MNFKKLAKDIAKAHSINVAFRVKNGHVWMDDADRGVCINIAVGRNRGYSMTGASTDRAAIYAKDDARRYAARCI